MKRWPSFVSLAFAGLSSGHIASASVTAVEVVLVFGGPVPGSGIRLLVLSCFECLVKSGKRPDIWVKCLAALLSRHS